MRSQMTSPVLPVAESSAVWLWPVSDGPSAEAPGGASAEEHAAQPACGAADRAVQDAPRHLPLPIQLCLWQDSKNCQVSSSLFFSLSRVFSCHGILETLKMFEAVGGGRWLMGENVHSISVSAGCHRWGKSPSNYAYRVLGAYFQDYLGLFG